MIIVQHFDKRFDWVAKRLPSLSTKGVTHVLVSPPQKSHASHSWWGRYQPVDFTRIEGPLGSLEDLYRLCQAGARHGISVVADTVIHHLSNESRYVKIRGNRIVSAQYPRFCQNDLAGLHRLGKGRGLPILDTNSDWVRSELKNYLRFLFDIGIRGFRFDSAKHIDPHLFPYLLEGLPPTLTFGELIYSRPEHYPQEYWRSMKAYDFPLAHSVSRAFSYHGDLGSLLTPDALWGPHAISFVNQHDLARNRSGFADFRVRDLQDRKLAYAYLLGRNHGIPHIYGPDLRYKEVKAALRFYRKTRSTPEVPVAASKTLLALKRGDSALMAINKSGRRQSVSASLSPGRYKDETTGWEGSTHHGTLSWSLPPRSAALLTRQG